MNLLYLHLAPSCSFVSFTSSPWSCHWKRIATPDKPAVGLQLLVSFEKRKFVYFFKPDYQGKYQGKSVSVKLKDSLIDFKQKINGTRFFNNVYSQVYHCEIFQCLRTQVSYFFQDANPNKKTEVFGATFCATGTPGVCYFHFGREKFLRISSKIYIMEFSQEKSLEDFLRIL